MGLFQVFDLKIARASGANKICNFFKDICALATLSELLRNLWHIFMIDRTHLVQVLEGTMASALIEVNLLPLLR
jgi:hypothetical protein